MNMFRIGLLAAACLVLTACQRMDDNDSMKARSNSAPPATSATVPPSPAPDRPVTPVSEAGVDEQTALGLLNAVNEHEIAAGNQALEHKVSGDVADYARMMIKQHSENLAETTALGPAIHAPRVQQKEREDQVELDILAAQSDAAYANAYIDAMVEGHTQALAMLDNTLIPAAVSPAVKSHFTDTRTHVQAHLALAKELQSSR